MTTATRQELTRLMLPAPLPKRKEAPKAKLVYKQEKQGRSSLLRIESNGNFVLKFI